MMPNKLMKLRDYLRWIQLVGWNLQKMGSDWKLIDANGDTRVRNIIVTHPGREVPGISVRKTIQALDVDGLQ